MPTKKLDTIDADTLLGLPYEPLSFVVEDLLPQGLHLLAGAPKIGKSWLALWLCLQVAQGEPVWNFITQPCEVLYLCLEDSFQRIQSRLFDLTESAPPTLHFAVMSEQLHSGLLEQIEQFLKERPNTGLVVIDTLQRIRSAGNEANPYASDYRDVGVLKALADQYRIAILLIHHLRKLNDDDPINMISGTTGLSGATDSNFVLRKNKRRDYTATLYCTGRDIAYRELSLEFDGESHIWRLLANSCEQDEQSDGRLTILLLNLLREQGEFIGTPTELSEKIDPDKQEGVTPKKVARLILQSVETLMASIRKRGESYLIVVSMGYDYNGKRIKPKQKTVHPPADLTPKQREKWLQEQAVLFERACRNDDEDSRSPDITLAKYIELWLEKVAPNRLAKSTVRRDRQDIARILPVLGHYRLRDLRPEYFRSFYAQLRKTVSQETKKPLSENTVEGVHATLCTILSDAVEGGFLHHNPAWRTYRYAGRKREKQIADGETVQKIITALENESIKYEIYFKLIIATGIRRGECCALQWRDIDWEQWSIHICRSAVKVTDEEIFVKEPKTRAGNRYVYFSPEMQTLLLEYQKECAYITETYDCRALEGEDFLFRRNGSRLPMTPTTFTWRFKLILRKNGLPENLNVHSLRHTNASLLIAGGADVATVAGLLGHSQPSTTLDIYTHAFDKNKRAASAILQKGLEI